MKANELRIGNFTENNVEIVKITAKDILFLSVKENEHFCNPIPLTEEWLIKFGFVKKTYKHLTLYYFSLKVLSHGEICFHPKDYGFNIDLGTTTGYQFGTTNIKYVHQLQNLYFALTNEEI